MINGIDTCKVRNFNEGGAPSFDVPSVAIHQTLGHQCLPKIILLKLKLFTRIFKVFVQIIYK